MQHFQTPIKICKIMADMIPTKVKTVLEPTPGDGNLVRCLAGYKVTAPKDFWLIGGVFDAVVMNPPFTPMATGYEILFTCMDMTDNVIALMPWLTLINSERRTNRLIEYGLKSVSHLPRSTFKGSRVQTCIIELRRGWQHECLFRAI